MLAGSIQATTPSLQNINASGGSIERENGREVHVLLVMEEAVPLFQFQRRLVEAGAGVRQHVGTHLIARTT
jgi:hypothetical protein